MKTILEPLSAPIPLSVLVVDDSPEIRQLFTSYLQGAPVTVDTVEDENSALGACQSKDYDYVFLDMQLPGTTGLHILESLKGLKLARSPQMLACTAAASASELEMYQAKGFNGSVPKPFTPGTLRMALKLQ